MRNTFLLIAVILTIYSCSTNKNSFKNIKQETVLIENPIDKNSNQMVNELRFTGKTKAGETQKFMQQEFGKQINDIPINRALPM